MRLLEISKMSEFDLEHVQLEFVTPVKILIEDLRCYLDEGARDNEQYSRVVMIQNYVDELEAAITEYQQRRKQQTA